MHNLQRKPGASINQGGIPQHQLNCGMLLIPTTFFLLNITRSLCAAAALRARARAIQGHQVFFEGNGSLAFNPAKDPVDRRLLSVELHFSSHNYRVACGMICFCSTENNQCKDKLKCLCVFCHCHCCSLIASPSSCMSVTCQCV